jgi:hypothetical protein
MLLLLSLTTMLFAATSKAQQSTVTEKTVDGYIVTIEVSPGVWIEHRAFGPAKMKELENTKAERDAFQADNIKANAEVAVLTDKNKLLQTNFDLQSSLAASYKADFDRSQEDAKRNFGLFMGEREIRVQQQQFIPHGKAGGFGGKVLSFLDSGYGQSLFKLVVPSATFLRTYTARCP